MKAKELIDLLKQVNPEADVTDENQDEIESIHDKGGWVELSIEAPAPLDTSDEE